MSKFEVHFEQRYRNQQGKIETKEEMYTATCESDVIAVRIVDDYYSTVSKFNGKDEVLKPSILKIIKINS
ncbi:hypothetical protein BKK51_08205 [Rodentibacter trehalosifermentans]|uniref:Uncharacterized protein n=1 Tax=Rodentibacter trehalosifermentans TaxID=1908263 RepID=A0A1V3IR83_9PAST|nr:hypothetical protein [Rodentibacter trehalosifermentans]OOF44768.1 hypothetical protein BKK51_08205 [Rodentibacter trehalosifermentans]OOF45598.1 hypothetical protein BKK52_12360 [Rodentibacter trehalosifermentans]